MNQWYIASGIQQRILANEERLRITGLFDTLLEYDTGYVISWI